MNLASAQQRIAKLLQRLAPQLFRTRMRRREFVLLSGILLLGATLWGALELVDEVMEGSTQSIDRQLLLAMRNPVDSTDPLGPEWVEEMGRDFTALGGVAVLLTVTAGAVGFLALQRKWSAASFLLVAVVGALLVSLGLKQFFERPRPELVPHGSHVYTASFPSGHAMMAASTYLTIGALLARVHRERLLKLYFVFLATILMLLVGISRVYLGVHWPSDVLAGWTFGASWALVCWLVAYWYV